MIVLPYLIGGVYDLFTEKPKSAEDLKSKLYARTWISGTIYAVALGALAKLQENYTTQALARAFSTGVAYTPSIFEKTVVQLFSPKAVVIALVAIPVLNGVFALAQYCLARPKE